MQKIYKIENYEVKIEMKGELVNKYLDLFPEVYKAKKKWRYATYKKVYLTTTTVLNEYLIDSYIDDLEVKTKNFEMFLETATYKNNFGDVVSYSNNQKKYIRTIYEHFLDYLYDNNLINFNYKRILEDIKITDTAGTRHRYSEEDMSEFFKTAENVSNDKTVVSMLKLLYATGLRKGECLGLKYSDVDVVKKTIHVQRSYDSQTTCNEVITKEYRYDRIVHLTEEAIDIIIPYMIRGARANPDDYIFTNHRARDNKKPYSSTTLRRIFHEIRNEFDPNKRMHIEDITYSASAH